MTKELANITVLIHGEYQEDFPDPPLSKLGKEQIEKAALKLSNYFNVVFVGEGKRHKETFRRVFKIQPRTVIVSDLVGKKEVLASDKKTIIFPDGKKILFKELMAQFERIRTKIPDFLRKIALDYPGKKVLIIGGRIVLIGAGLEQEEIKLGEVYHISFTPLGEIVIKEKS